MLILTRKKGEALVIGDDIVITVADLEDGRVKLGIDAPKNLKVLRREVIDEVAKFNKEASASKLGLLDTLKKINNENK